MTHELAPALRPDFFGQLAATDPYQGRARRLFERGQVVAVNGNQADLLVGYDARNNPLELKQVPIISGYVPRMGDWVSIQYEAGHSGAPWVTGPSMAADDARDSAGIGVFSVSDAEPADPQRSMIYFDESHETWRGWDGTDWVDFSAKLHNNLPDLQGGGGGDYFHLAAGEHTALQDLEDGTGLASAWVKRLRFKAIDASASQRTQMFEVNGDFYWAVNATYDEGADQWNRVDTSKYAYLIGVHSEGNIPTEPIGGVVWWRATPGANPIGDWAAVGGWELGYMMTEHRNFVMGGMNLEMDGSGAPPYGRFTHSGSNDASGTVVTAMQRNSWYEGSGQWGRDSHDKSSAIIGFDAEADFFVWWYPDSSEGSAPWQTSAWQQRAHFHLGEDGIRGRLDVIRSSSETAIGSCAFLSTHKTSGDMADGFGAGYAFAVEDDAGVENIIAAIYGVRHGADSSGELKFHVASGGTLTCGARLSPAGLAVPQGHLNVGTGGYASSVGEIGTDKILIGSTTDYITLGGSGDDFCLYSGDQLRFYPASDAILFLKGSTNQRLRVGDIDSYTNPLDFWINASAPYVEPFKDSTWDLGSSLRRFANLYIDRIYLGAAYLDGTAVAGRIDLSGDLNVQGNFRCDSFRVDQTPIAGSISPTHHITISCNGTSYKIPCTAA